MNSYRLIATSDNWNVTYREHQTAFTPILITFSRKVVRGPVFDLAGQDKAAKEVAELVEAEQRVVASPA